MGFAGWKTTGWAAFLCAFCLLVPGSLRAQAPPGPLPPSHPLPPPPKAPAPKKKPEIESRSSLAGFWKLNKEESDTPRKKSKVPRHDGGYPGGGPGGPGGSPGGGPRVGVGYPYPGG